LFDAALAAGASRYVMQSIAFTYAPDSPALRTENDPVFADAPPPWKTVLPPLFELERRVTGTPQIDGVVLRYGYFYGPGTIYAPGAQIHEDVRRRRFPIAGSGCGMWSFVHVEDAASAATAAVERGDPGIYNVVDDEPSPLKVWLPVYAELIGAKPPLHVPAPLVAAVAGPLIVHWATSQPGVSNEKAKRELAWRPRHPTWREGFRALVEDR
jgi:nucleoside-diphosphate-sugar epimerase